MARRYIGNMNGERYLANTITREVHDLDQEEENCHIDMIIAAGNDKPYDSLAAAHLDGYDNGHHCIGGSTR